MHGPERDSSDARRRLWRASHRHLPHEPRSLRRLHSSRVGVGRDLLTGTRICDSSSKKSSFFCFVKMHVNVWKRAHCCIHMWKQNNEHISWRLKFCSKTIYSQIHIKTVLLNHWKYGSRRYNFSLFLEIMFHCHISCQNFIVHFLGNSCRNGHFRIAYVALHRSFRLQIHF